MKKYKFIPKSFEVFSGKKYETAELIEINNRWWYLREKRFCHKIWRIVGTVYWKYLHSPIYFPGNAAEKAEIDYYLRE